MADQPKKWIRPAVRSGQRSVTAPDGIGFGVTHSMVTMMFENSLQLVNPMISLPYWDFTIEGAVVDNDEELAGDYTRLSEASPLWTPDWFGGVDKHDYQVGFFFLSILLCWVLATEAPSSCVRGGHRLAFQLKSRSRASSHAPLAKLRFTHAVVVS